MTNYHGSPLPRHLALILAVGGWVPTVVAAQSQQRRTAITNVTVIGVRNDMVLRKATVLVEGQRISAVGPATSVAVPAGSSRIDGSGKFLIPGLWDMHVHLVLEGRQSLPMYLRHGVTGVREMGGRLEDVQKLRDDVERKTVIGPRIVASGPQLESPESIRGVIKDASATESARVRLDRVEIQDVDRASAVVDSLARLGLPFVKARSFASVDVYWAIANAARKNHIGFVGHAPFGLEIDPVALADSGQQSLEHWYFPSDLPKRPRQEYQRIVNAYVRSGIALVPTLAAWRQHCFTYDSVLALIHAAVDRSPHSASVSPDLLEHWRAEARSRAVEGGGRPLSRDQLSGWNKALDDFALETGRLRSAGVVVLPGSDMPLGRLPGEGLIDELALLVREAGFTPLQAIESATRRSAEFLGMQDSLGVIAAGMVADVVLLSANPLENIENLRDVEAVFLSGRLAFKRRPP